MKMGELIPVLNQCNVKIRNLEVNKMDKAQLRFVFQLVDIILKSQIDDSNWGRQEFKQYQSSYTRKKILSIWKNGRGQWLSRIHFANSSEEVLIDLYEEIEPLLFHCCQEEYTKVKHKDKWIAFRIFLWHQEWITHHLRLFQDKKYWTELIDVVEKMDEKIAR
ncbi:hypothetical protein IC619_004545 [Hazenella sp. IB182353]|nr:RepB family plasmid replication initiator protein [Polycladospora coralii]MBS7529765.1 hypothetical protein [Polycladospora coralii]